MFKITSMSLPHTCSLPAWWVFGWYPIGTLWSANGIKVGMIAVQAILKVQV